MESIKDKFNEINSKIDVVKKIMTTKLYQSKLVEQLIEENKAINDYYHKIDIELQVDDPSTFTDY